MRPSPFRARNASRQGWCHMGWIWDDRLAEVWAPPGKAGSGVVIGTCGVLTARHVIERSGDRRAAGSGAGPGHSPGIAAVGVGADADRGRGRGVGPGGAAR